MQKEQISNKVPFLETIFRSYSLQNADKHGVTQCFSALLESGDHSPTFLSVVAYLVENHSCAQLTPVALNQVPLPNLNEQIRYQTC